MEDVGEQELKDDIKAFVLVPWKDVAAIYLTLEDLLSVSAWQKQA